MEDATIIALFDKQEKSMKEFISTTASLNRLKLINIIDPVADDVSEIKTIILPKISEDNDIRNHRINKLEDQTVVVRWMHRKPGRVAAGFITFLFSIVISSAFLATRIDPEKTVEELTPLEFKEDEVQGPNE